MINKDFKAEWKWGGEVGIIEADHFSLDIDRDFCGIGFELSWKLRMVYIKLLHIVIRFY